jgi:putative ABC transport system permease protein
VLDPPASSTLDPEQRRISSGDAATRAVLVMVVVAIVIEVVLLAGPAFAVGVRRRRRDLALLAATGSTPRDIRRSVLAQAGFVGVGAATAGALIGLPLARLGMPIAEHFGAGFGPFDWRWTEPLLALLVGGAAALIAAWAPAVQASRSDVATVLAGRRGVLRSRPGWPLLGLVLIGAGTAATLTKGTRAGGEVWVSGGTIVIVLGAVAATPWLVGQVGRLATRLPLPLRLATRDASRQRARTAPAVAAIMASVIGITALAIGFASDNKQSRRDYEPRTAAGVATVNIPGRENQQSVVDTIRAIVPGRTLFIGQSADPDAQGSGLAPGSAPSTPPERSRQVTLAAPGCTLVQAGGFSDTGQNDCANKWQQVNTSGYIVAYDVPTLKAFGVPLTSAQESVLGAGGILVASPAALRGDHALIGVVSTNEQGKDVRVEKDLTVPAALLPSAGPRTARVATVVMTPKTAQTLGLSLNPSQLVIGGPTLTSGQEDRLNSKLGLIDSSVYVERGFTQPYGVILALLALVGALVVLVATVTATGLAMSESRPDLATLAAVGAPPRTRRYVAASQAVVIGLLGTGLGVALGFVPGLAVTWPLTAGSYSSYAPPEATGPVIAIPWTMLLIVVVAVPVVAGLVTGLFTRSRLPMVRRLAT